MDARHPAESARVRAGCRCPGPVLAAAIALLAIPHGHPASAALSVSPPAQEVLLAPAATSEGAWRVRNTGADTTTVTVSAIRYRQYAGGDRDAAGPDWLRVEPDSFALAPGGARGVSFRASCPAEASGEELVMVFFAERSGTLQGRIGTAFYRMVAGTLRPALRLISCRPLRAGAAGLRFLLELENPGNVHLRPQGTIELWAEDGDAPLARARLGAGMPVQPGGRERFGTEPVSPEPPPGAYVVRVRLESGWVGEEPGPVLCDTVACTVSPAP